MDGRVLEVVVWGPDVREVYAVLYPSLLMPQQVDHLLDGLLGHHGASDGLGQEIGSEYLDEIVMAWGVERNLCHRPVLGNGVRGAE
jgi:hypothetical protein